VGHHPSDLNTHVRRPPLPELFYTPEELARLVGPGWDITACEARPRPVADPATDAAGHHVLVHDTVLQATRHPV
jgi:hypothetical protein